MEGVRDIGTDNELDSVVISNVVGVSMSVIDERDEGRAGTGVKGGNGECGVTLTGAGDGGIVLMRATDDGEPVGRRMDVSNDTSIPSGSMTERSEGEGRKIDDS